MDTGGRMAIGVLAVLAGMAVQLREPQLWPVEAYGAALAAAALAAGLAWVRARRRAAARLALLVLAGAAAGFGSTGWRAIDRVADALPAALEGQDLVVTGTVASLPRVTPAGTRFVLQVESARRADGTPVPVPERLALGWWRGVDGEAWLAGPGPDLRAGQRWELPLRLRRPHGAANPHGFDVELWLFEQGIRAVGHVRATRAGGARLLATAAAHPVARLRQSLRDAIERTVDDGRLAGVLAALAIGDQAAIERDDWELFRLTGVAHLLSISGVHVTMFAWLAGGLAGMAWRASPRLMLAVPAPMAARWIALAAAAGYALLAGWGVPAQRTVGMVAVVVVLRTLGWRWPGPLVLLAAGFAVALGDPWALLQPGFWLSFVAVGLLMGSQPARGVFEATAADADGGGAAGWRAQVRRTLKAGLHTQVVASVGLAPLTLVFFQQLSLVGFAANLVAIPLVTLLVTPLALAGVLAAPLWLAAAGLVQGLVWLLERMAAVPWAVWTAAAAPAWAAAAGLLGGALLVLPLPARLRLLGLPMLLPLLAPAPERPAEGRFELLAADVGQGTAVLVRTRRELLVYDAGPAWSPQADAGSRLLLPLLRARGERRIDRLVLSHRDTDHVGGAAALLAGLPVGALVSSLDGAHPLRAAGPPHGRCEAGQRWRVDGVAFEVLHPPVEAYANPAARPNTLSCVLRVEAADGTSALLTGDIEAAQEAAMVAAHGARLASTLLLVPHHGSRTSSTAGFLAAVSPRLAVVQAAYRSRFGHPAPEVLARHEAAGIEVFRSDTCGAFTWGGAAPVCERLVSRRYWHHPGAAAPAP